MRKKAINSNGGEKKLRQLVTLVEPSQFNWLHQAAKSQKMKLAPFLRTLLSYLMENSPKNLYSKMAETRLKAEIEQATKTVEEATRIKEAKEAELAELAE